MVNTNTSGSFAVAGECCHCHCQTMMPSAELAETLEYCVGDIGVEALSIAVG